MGKIMKPGKVVLVLSGRYAGRKAIVVKNYDEGTSEKPHGHAFVAGIDSPQKDRQKQNPKTLQSQTFRQGSKLRPLDAHSLLRRLQFGEIQCSKNVKDPAKRKKLCFNTRVRFEERYKSGRNKWFFQKLRF